MKKWVATYPVSRLRTPGSESGLAVGQRSSCWLLLAVSVGLVFASRAFLAHDNIMSRSNDPFKAKDVRQALTAACDPAGNPWSVLSIDRLQLMELGRGGFGTVSGWEQRTVFQLSTLDFRKVRCSKLSRRGYHTTAVKLMWHVCSHMCVLRLLWSTILHVRTRTPNSADCCRLRC